MSAPRLRAAVDAAQRDWAQAIARVAGRWARDLEVSDAPTTVTASMRRMLTRETANAAAHGVEQVARMLAAGGISPPKDLGVPVTGPPLTLERTIGDVWRSTAQLPSTARRAALERIIDQSLTNAWRDGMHAAMAAAPEVIGWRRVARAGCCGACLALADGRMIPLDVPLDGHPHCHCVAEPVIKGVNDRRWGRQTGQQRWEAMSPAEQDEMFHGHGGAAKADVIRSGDASLDDLVAWAPRDPEQPNHRQLPRETTLRELQLDENARAEHSHRTGIEFGADARSDSVPASEVLATTSSPAFDEPVTVTARALDYWTKKPGREGITVEHVLAALRSPTLVVANRPPFETTRSVLVSENFPHTRYLHVVISHRPGEPPTVYNAIPARRLAAWIESRDTQQRWP